jgi:protein involved in polysaccharide export with SLBB domain
MLFIFRNPRIRMHPGVLPLLGAALVLSSPPAGAQQAEVCSPSVTSQSAPDSSRRSVGALRSGDLLKINVFRMKEISGDYLIDSDGRLVIPGLGSLMAAGLGPRDVEANLRELLVCRGFVPDVSVQALVRVSIAGEVRTPGTFPVEPGISVLRVLTLAGGQTPNADLSKAHVVREGRAYPVDLNAALAGGAAGNVILNSNDVVVVPKKSGFTREDAAFALGVAGVLLSALNVVVTLTRR